MFIIIVDWSNWHGRYLIHSFAMAYRPKTPGVLQPKLRSPQAENRLHSFALHLFALISAWQISKIISSYSEWSANELCGDQERQVNPLKPWLDARPSGLYELLICLLRIVEAATKYILMDTFWDILDTTDLFCIWHSLRMFIMRFIFFVFLPLVGHWLARCEDRNLFRPSCVRKKPEHPALFVSFL